MRSVCGRRCFLIRGAGLAAGMAVGGAGLCGCNKQSEQSEPVERAVEMIAYCGQDCVKCRIYLATIERAPEKQKQMREGIARYIKEHFGEEVRPEEITDCYGCKTESGKLLPSCQKCKVRKCAREKRVANCAYCREYPCEKLSELYDSGSVEADAKKRLDEIKTRL